MDFPPQLNIPLTRGQISLAIGSRRQQLISLRFWQGEKWAVIRLGLFYEINLRYFFRRRRLSRLTRSLIHHRSYLLLQNSEEPLFQMLGS